MQTRVSKIIISQTLMQTHKYLGKRWMHENGNSNSERISTQCEIVTKCSDFTRQKNISCPGPGCGFFQRRLQCGVTTQSTNQRNFVSPFKIPILLLKRGLGRVLYPLQYLHHISDQPNGILSYFHFPDDPHVIIGL